MTAPMTTLPEEAVKAALDTWQDHEFDGTLDYPRMRNALTAALPFLPVQGEGEREAVLNYKTKLRVAFRKALSDLPEIAPAEVASILSSVRMEDEFWREGKRLQLEHGLDAVAPRVEQECGAGAWSFIRKGILSALEPSAARELALEEIIALCRDYGEDSQPDSEYRLACNDIIEAIQERHALSYPDHAEAGKVEGDGWLPIESAPKDGTSILAVCAGVHERTGIPFIPEVVEWTQYGWSNEMWGEQPNHGVYSPTHWRPLPSAPSQEVAG